MTECKFEIRTFTKSESCFKIITDMHYTEEWEHDPDDSTCYAWFDIKTDLDDDDNDDDPCTNFDNPTALRPTGIHGQGSKLYICFGLPNTFYEFDCNYNAGDDTVYIETSRQIDVIGKAYNNHILSDIYVAHCDSTLGDVFIGSSNNNMGAYGQWFDVVIGSAKTGIISGRQFIGDVGDVNIPSSNNPSQYAVQNTGPVCPGMLPLLTAATWNKHYAEDVTVRYHFAGGVQHKIGDEHHKLLFYGHYKEPRGKDEWTYCHAQANTHPLYAYLYEKENISVGHYAEKDGVLIGGWSTEALRWTDTSKDRRLIFMGGINKGRTPTVSYKIKFDGVQADCCRWSTTTPKYCRSYNFNHWQEEYQCLHWGEGFQMYGYYVFDNIVDISIKNRIMMAFATGLSAFAGTVSYAGGGDKSGVFYFKFGGNASGRVSAILREIDLSVFENDDPPYDPDSNECSGGGQTSDGQAANVQAVTISGGRIYVLMNGMIKAFSP